MLKKQTILHLLRYAVLASTAVFVLTLLFNLYIHLSSQKHILHTDILAHMRKGTALVLGTTPKTKRGENNSYFTARIEGAVQLYQQGSVSHIVVSGDNRTIYYNEPRAMKQALLRYGVLEKDIIEDFAGRDTYDSIIRARDVFGITQPIIITQQYHAERALFIAHWNGIDAKAYVVPGSQNHFIMLKQYTREYFARIKMIIELLQNRNASITGTYEPIK